MTDDVTNKTMVAGFLFCGGHVLLVQKNRPTWQKDLWNGIGGVVEPGEEPQAAMVREFLEETGLHVPEWQCFCTEVEPFGASVHFFRASVDGDPATLLDRQVNDSGEALRFTRTWEENQIDVLGNLHWLIPMARDWRGTVSVVYSRGDIREQPSW